MIGSGAVRHGGRSAVAGMILRDGADLLDGGERGRRPSLDGQPFPAYHLLKWDRYTHARVITTRGCSYRCSFCDVTALWGNRSVFRRLEHVLEEMEHLRDRYAKSSIAIVDDTFVLNGRRVEEFCKELIRRRAAIEWGCFGRINLMTSELIEAHGRGGLSRSIWGMESTRLPGRPGRYSEEDAGRGRAPYAEKFGAGVRKGRSLVHLGLPIESSGASSRLSD